MESRPLKLASSKPVVIKTKEESLERLPVKSWKNSGCPILAALFAARVGDHDSLPTVNPD